MTNDEREDERPRYDLEERTALFGEAVIAFSKRVPQNVVSVPLIRQLVRCGTSIGANYCEADDARSQKRNFARTSGRAKKRHARQSILFG